MSARPYILAETTWKTVDATPYEVAVLPWGATEAHNYHLPYATDTIQCDHLAARAAERAWSRGARVAVLPTGPFGVNATRLDINLCPNMNPRLRGIHEGWAWAPRRWTQVTSDTGIGNSAKATAEKGAAYVAAAAERIGDYLIELAALKLDELYE